MVSQQKFIVISVPESLIPDLDGLVGPVLLYLDHLQVEDGFALAPGEFVTSITAYNEACILAGTSSPGTAIIKARD
ncbi:hypothetical protein [Klebsiella aerogenes]|uniref:hypothetical protein n=1 Tax=Klebsiella aerogenes TaxID=548 RepID=UPI001F41D208|nr:hypothetical protein [Klebsiella aerogenes]